MTALGVGKGELWSARHVQSQILSLGKVLTFYLPWIFKNLVSKLRLNSHDIKLTI